MSKRKSRRKPLTSEITSVMRAPAVEIPESETEPPLDADTELANTREGAEPAEGSNNGGASDVSVPRRGKATRQTARIGAVEPPPEAKAPVRSAFESDPDDDDALAHDDIATVNDSSSLEDSLADDVDAPDSATLSGFPDSAEDDTGAFDRPIRGTAADSNDDVDPGDEDEPDVVPLPRIANLDGEDSEDTEAFLSGLIEALLFTSQRPLPLKDLARSAGIDRPRAQELVTALALSYAPRGLCIDEVAGGFVMRSSPRYAPYIQKVLSLRPIRLSRAQLETLAIIAYRQPVTKPEVDDIRGVDSGQVIKGLLERSLLKILGKKDEPGRPMLYGTTNDFLELLNLQSLKDLPTLREYTELSDESRQKFMDETGEVAPEDDAPGALDAMGPSVAALTENDDTRHATATSSTSDGAGDRGRWNGDSTGALDDDGAVVQGDVEAAVQEDTEALIQQDLDGERMEVIEESQERRDAAAAGRTAMGSDSESTTSIGAADEEVEEEEEEEEDDDDDDDEEEDDEDKDEDEEPEEGGEGDLDEDDEDDDDDDDEEEEDDDEEA